MGSRHHPVKKANVLKNFSLLLFLIWLVWFGVSPAHAQPYLSGNIGGYSVNDADINDGDDDGEVSFDDGFVATGALGRTVGSAGRVEAELGYRANDIDKTKIDGEGEVANDGDLATISLMGNAYYDFNIGSSFTPFLGAGIGLANIEADTDLTDKENDTVFAYQLAAGGSLAVGEKLNIDLQYRYFATDDPEFDGVEAEYNTHNLMFGLRFTF